MSSPAGIERLRTLNALLAEVLALPPGEREAWLDSLEGPARALSGELRSMLTHSDTGFMSRAVEVPGELLAAGADREGDLVGPYRLLRPLGEGGMATVWLAERADGAMQRQVALKLPRLAWARGLTQRMARERDILAGLEHPHIARLYDAGLVANGRPWLAMEFVDGRPLDQYCSQEALDVRARLGLFLQVCEALSHAHGRLVVHRDLKPSNILVTRKGSVRLLDFGVAKLLHGDELADPGLTQFQGRAFTPDYASPEQLRGEPLGTASDVYSLGVVLYELLCGQRPHAPRREPVGDTAFDEALPLASTKAADRRLAAQLRGDLDTILDKSLRHRAASRYASVEAFAQDIRRHLEGEPVLARPPSASYRAAKFASRHRWPLAAAGAVAAALAAGAGLAVGEAREAERQRALAFEQASQAESALEFAGSVITGAITSDGHITREVLVRRAMAQAEGRTDANPDDLLIVADSVSGWYQEMGQYRDAEDILERTLARVPSGVSGLRTVLECRHALVRANLGRTDEAISAFERILADTRLSRETMATCLLERSIVAHLAGDNEASLRIALRAREMFSTLSHVQPKDRAAFDNVLSFAYFLVGQIAEADRHAESAMVQAERAGRGRGLAAAIFLNNWAIILMSTGNPAEAIDRLDRALGIAQRQSPKGESPGYLLANRGVAELQRARIDEAEQAFEALLPVARAAGNGIWQVAAYAGFAEIELVRGNLRAARSHLEECERIAARFGFNPGVGPLRRLAVVKGALLIQEGRIEAAREQIDATIAEMEAARLRVGLASVPYRQRSLLNAREGRLEEALADAERSLELAVWAQGGRPHSAFTGAAWLAIARVHDRAGRTADARVAARKAVPHLEAVFDAGGALPSAARDLSGAP